MEYDQTVTIALEDDSTIECVVLMIFEAEGREYIAVTPMDQEDEDDSEVYLYRYTEDEKTGEPSLDNIESDEEYEIVSDAFDEILDEQEMQELMGSDDEEYGDETVK